MRGSVMRLCFFVEDIHMRRSARLLLAARRRRNAQRGHPRYFRKSHMMSVKTALSKMQVTIGK
ncbi:MAG: hypothetical protein JWQ04_1828 [Pedosphaera sp.]|nr:hypothetical protein [Pedosphaera sp.]